MTTTEFRTTSRGDRNGDGARQRPSVTLGEWLDALGSETAPRAPSRSRAERDDRPEDRILAAALAELDARDRRMERRSSDMMDALDRFMDKAERPPARRTGRDPERDGRLAAALDQIERRLEDIAARIDDRQTARGPGSAPELDGRLADIARRIDEANAARASEPRQDDRLARLETTLATLVKRLESRPEDAPGPMNGPRRRPRPALDASVAEIRAHQIQLDQGVRAHAPAPAPAPVLADDIGERLAAIADRIESAQGRTLGALAPAVADIQAGLAGLSARMAAPSSPPAPLDLAPLRAQLRADVTDLAQRLDVARAPADLGPLRDQLRADVQSLAQKIEAGAVDLGPVKAQLAALTHSVADMVAASRAPQTAPAQIVDALVGRIDAAGERIAGDLRREVQAALATRSEADLAGALDSLSIRVNEAGDRIAAEARRDIQTAIGELREAALAHSEAPEPIAKAIQELASRFDRAYARLDDGTAIARLEDHLGALNEKLDDIASRARAGEDAAPSAATTDLSGLERMIRTLTERMEATRGSGSDAHHFESLKAQISLVAAHLEEAGAAQPLRAIERTVGELFTQIDLLRTEREQAVEILVQRANEAAERNPRLEALAEDVSDIRRSRETIDRRTQDTLGAIHEALTKVVQRLGAVEKEIAHAPHPVAGPVRAEAAPPPIPAPHVAPPVAPPTRAFAAATAAAEADAPLPKRRRDAPPMVETPAEKSRFSLKLPFMGRAAGADKPAPAVPPAGSPAEAASPGSASSRAASSRTKAATPGAALPDMPLEPGSGRPGPGADMTAAAKANFIAAARRAAQMAAEDASRRPGDAPEPDHAAAEGGGLVDRSRSFVESRKRPILIGLAALLVAVIAVNVLVPAPQEPGAPVPRPPEAPAAAPGPAPAPAAPPAAEPRADAAPAATDPVAVGSIPDIAPAAVPKAIPATAPTAPPDLPAGLTSQVLRAAALRGDPGAAHEVGARLMDGRGVARDPKLALQWFERAAAEGLAPAQFRVGNMYEKGVGAARDLKLAKSWYVRAAEKGNAKALHNLGVLLAEGGEGRPDYAAAGENFRKAAQLGVRDSQYNYAILLARGLGVEADAGEAYRWLAIAAAQGDDEAAKKRDEIAARLAPEALAAAKAAAESFKPATQDKLANEAPSPERGWDPPVAAAPARAKAKPDQRT